MSLRLQPDAFGASALPTGVETGLVLLDLAQILVGFSGVAADAIIRLHGGSEGAGGAPRLGGGMRARLYDGQWSAMFAVKRQVSPWRVSTHIDGRVWCCQKIVASTKWSISEISIGLDTQHLVH